MPIKPNLVKPLMIIFGLCLLYVNRIDAASGVLTKEKALSVFAALEESNNYDASIRPDNLISLPLGVRVPIGAFVGTIAVSSVITHDGYKELTVFACLDLPFQSPEKIYFGAQGIKLSDNGTILGDASLLLLEDIRIPVLNGNAELVLKGDFNINTGTGRELTYVKITCNNFKEVGIAADIAFPESLMVPVNSFGEHIPGQRVRGHFNTIINGWNDIVAAVNLPPFELCGLDGFIFELQNAVFDFSEKQKAATVVYPSDYNYAAAGVFDGRLETWQGFFAQNLKVLLPKAFSGNDRPRISMEAHNMLIDATGVSGAFAANNILSFEDGNLGGWAFSLSHFELSLLSNVLTGAAFSGEIGIPLAPANHLGYTGIIDADNNYLLRINTLSEMSFDVFKAKATLEKNSYIQLTVKDQQFLPEAMLHGRLDIASTPQGASSSGGINAAFKGITFRSLHLQTLAPYISVDYLGYNGELKLMNFPLSGENISLACNNDQVALNFGLKLTLSDGMFSGATGLKFSGRLTKNETGRMIWEYEKMDVADIKIDATVAEAFELHGFLRVMNNDPVYGDGFAGNIDLALTKGLDLKVGVRTIFGYKDFRYWLMDGNIKIPGGVYVPPCFLITDFGGGVNYRMSPDLTGISGMPTGLRYVPDKNKGLGLRAAVMFNAGSGGAILGEALFEMAFNANGGLNFIGFYGKVDILPGNQQTVDAAALFKTQLSKQQAQTKGDKTKEAQLEKAKIENPNQAAAVVNKGNTSEVPLKSSAAITADAGIIYDFQANSLHANFNMYMEVAGGMIHGSGPYHKAGCAELHADPNDWYIYVGVPDDPVGITLSVGPVNANTSAYFMVGTKILNSPPPPKQVADILGVQWKDLDYMSNLNALGEGRGFAFGARLNVSTGDLRFLMFYALFEAGLGFDIMIKDYGDAYCEGRNGPIGMNGWYANGQAFAYLQGELGIFVDFWFFTARVPILSAGAAALLQAKLPNPSWFKGMLGVCYNVLGGVISGRCNFKFTIGEECKIVAPGSSPIDMEMIADISPRKGSRDVDVFSNPQVTFNMPVGKIFNITDDDGKRKLYRIKLNEFSVKDGTQVLSAIVKWNSSLDIADCISHEVFPPNKSLTVTVRVGFEEYTNGRWIVTKTGGIEAQEKREITFLTGEAPDHIPTQNIVYTYPVVDQQYFLKSESPKGFVQLDKGQSYLFSGNFNYIVRATAGDNRISEEPLSYHSGDKRLNYTIPGTQNSTAYTLTFVSEPQRRGATTTRENKITEIKNEEGAEIVKREKQAADVIGDQAEMVLLEYDFSTSRFNSFHEKIEGVTGPGLWWNLGADITHLIRKGRVEEAFDVVELEGNNFTAEKPLISLEATLDDDYYNKKIGPLLYKNYPVDGEFYIKHRNTMHLGVAPAKAIYVIPKYITDGIAGNNKNILNEYFPFYYGLREAYKQDYLDIATQIVNRYVDTAIPEILRPIAWYGCPYFEEGTYNTNIFYTLPDGTKTSVVPFWYKHTF